MVDRHASRRKESRPCGENGRGKTQEEKEGGGRVGRESEGKAREKGEKAEG